LWKSFAATVVTIFLTITYTQNIYALVGFFLVALALSPHCMSSGAAHGETKAQRENFFTALGTLMGRNRRRYGGYIIHISMALMAIGILGIEIFQKETQGTLAAG
jgi:cytochrome c-type biogenesis protein CcmF